jgi:replicative DNA helicase
MGKSTLAYDFIRSASIQHKLPSAIFTLEAGRNEVGMRLLSAEARVALHHMRSGTMTDEDWTRLARRMPDVSAAPIYIQDGAYSNVHDLRAHCRYLYSRAGVQLVVVDAVHLLTYGTRPLGSRYEEISEIARCLKLLAKELRLPIVAISTLNRGPEQRTDRKPMINDLRDSGALEDNADVVILIHREDAYEKDSPRAGEADLIVAKHRHGPTATITVAFQGHYSRFVDMAQL